MVSKSVKAYKNRLSKLYGKEGITTEKGSTQLSPELLELSSKISNLVVGIGAHSEAVRLPNTTVRQPELTGLLLTLLDSLITFDGNVRFVAPVCPDYSQESSDTFYQTIGVSISPQARAALRAAVVLDEVAKPLGFTPQIDILVADTEDDLPEVMERCVQGSVEEYKQRCRASVAEMHDQIQAYPNITVNSFTEGLGEEFRHTQYAYENVISDLRIADVRVADEVEKMGEMRKDRHSKILGRPEQDYELTVRYMAQYAALGTLMRGLNEPTVLLNYPTPNLPFYNAAAYRSKEFSLSADDAKVIPVVTTVL